MAGNSNGNVPWWQSWIFIVMMFAFGLWPIGVAMLLLRVFDSGNDGKKSNGAPWSVTMPNERTQSTNGAGVRQQGAATGGKAVEKRKKKRKGALILKIVGAVLALISAFSCAGSVAGLIDGWSFYWEYLIHEILGIGCGIGLFARGQYLSMEERQLERFEKSINHAMTMDLDILAKRMNCSPQKCAKKLQKLIDKELLSKNYYIDYEKNMVVRFGAEAQASAKAREKEVESEPVPKEANEGYSGILRNLRRVNDRIPDEKLSAQIDELERISALIFKAVEEDPEKRDLIRSFFDYYLPTTQKLLDAYASFDETGVDGEHLREAKARIEETMDGIVEGFEHQLDQLYSADAMDVVSDVKVMQTMLHRDTATVEKDFGYSRYPEKAEKSADDEEDKPQQIPMA